MTFYPKHTTATGSAQYNIVISYPYRDMVCLWVQVHTFRRYRLWGIHSSTTTGIDLSMSDSHPIRQMYHEATRIQDCVVSRVCCVYKIESPQVTAHDEMGARETYPKSNKRTVLQQLASQHLKSDETNAVEARVNKAINDETINQNIMRLKCWKQTATLHECSIYIKQLWKCKNRAYRKFHNRADENGQKPHWN